MDPEDETGVDDQAEAPHWKSAAPLSFALGEKEGDVLVAFAKADGTSIDKDGHVTDVGAFPTKSVPISAYGHTSWPEKGSRLPVGVGEIGEDAGEAKMAGRFLVDTTHGRDHYLTVKALGPLQEWSYGYKILERAVEKSADAGRRILRLKKLDVFEVSPTLVGAGNGTRTLAIKSDDGGPLAGLPYADELERVLLEVDGIVTRSKSLRDLRAKEGRELSTANRTRLERLRDSIAALSETASEVEEMLRRNSPDPEDPDAKALGLRLFTEYQQTIAGLGGVAVRLG